MPVGLFSDGDALPSSPPQPANVRTKATATATTAPLRTFALRRMLMYSAFLSLDRRQLASRTVKRVLASPSKEPGFEGSTVSGSPPLQRREIDTGFSAPSPGADVLLGAGSGAEPRVHLGSMTAVAVALLCLLSVPRITESPTAASVVTVTVNSGGTTESHLAVAAFREANSTAFAHAPVASRPCPLRISSQSAGWRAGKSRFAKALSRVWRAAAKAAASAAPWASLRLTPAIPTTKKASPAKSRPATTTM